MRAFITGITGMIGTHLEQVLRARGYEVFGMARATSGSRYQPLRPEFLTGDILDIQTVTDALARVKPDCVFHLAAQAYNGSSWGCERLTHETNYTGTLNVLRACRNEVPEAKVLLACSSAEYGIIPEEQQPIREDRPLNPVSPYGVSKASAEHLGFQYGATYGMRVYFPRCFIHVGPGHPPATAVQNFARQLALIAHGRQEPVLRVGRLDTRRDFIDVRDGVEAMVLLVERGTAGQPVNICTGRAYSIREMLDILLSVSGLKVSVEHDPALVRPADEPLLIGDNSRLKALGWRQRYTFEETLRDVYQDWLSRTKSD